MWMIGRSQRVEGNKYRPIVRKIRYLVFVGELKKNVTRQTLASSISFWRVLVSVHSPFWRVFEKNGFPHCHDMSIKICTNEHQVLEVTILTYKCIHCVT